MLDTIETVLGTSAKLRIYSGSVPANPAASIGAATLLVEMALPSDYLNAASGGTKTLLGVWSGVAAASGTPTFFRLWDSAGTTCSVQGTAGVNSGEMSLNGTITSGQTVTETAWTVTEGNP